MVWSSEWKPRGTALAATVLSWVLLVHMAGLYLFTRGFLLTRMALPDISACDGENCSLPATHQRVVLLIIDALRFDFVSPDPPSPASPFHHDVLTLPRELTAKYPDRSFLFNSFSDPPTTTLQRIKGITTGSLPTFVDVGSNFAGSAIEEDSIINQLSMAGKRTAFMGDDTWMTVFPTLFAPNMTHPYDSFNVEDLHTVDKGVIRHLLPLLEDKSHSWDAIIGHFLGVDHVGHRVGPDHPAMKSKLTQMNDVLHRVVEQLEDDTLLVVLGDHGMDRKGDHGGDDIFETSAAMWIYSKGVSLSDSASAKLIPSDILTKITYPDSPTPYRWIQQIDIVPTLSLLLGLPIPFNNLGSVIPEIFSRDSVLDKASRLNAAQMHRYLTAYRASTSDGELDALWPSLDGVWQTLASHPSVSAYFDYTRISLESCRSLWAQFNVKQMSMGLGILATSVITVAALYMRLGSVSDWESWASKRVAKIIRISGTSAIASPVVYLALGRVIPEIGLFDYVLAIPSLTSCAALLWDVAPSFKIYPLQYPLFILILHSLCFFSNSFVFWEDRIAPFFLISLLVPAIRVGLTAPMERYRKRILFFSAIYGICIRLMAFSTVCREEQQPYCRVTFYASSALSAPPIYALVLSLPMSFALPSVLRRFIALSASDKGLVPKFINYVFRPALVASTISWILEWAETTEPLGPEWSSVLRTARTVVACTTFGGVLVGGIILWLRDPRTLDIRTSTPKDGSDKAAHPRSIVVLNTNAYGSPYLLFWCIAFALVYLATQLAGQLHLALAAMALLAHLEISDTVRDVQGTDMRFSGAKLSAVFDVENQSSPPFSFGQLMPLALLGVHAFHATGHQATFASMQWKTAFLFSSTVSPMSRISFILNTVGPQGVFALSVPLLACWQVVNTTSGSRIISRAELMGESVRAGIGIMLYYAIMLLSSAASAAVLRRHLMVWKVFAPRFMSAAIGLATVDIMVLVGVIVGVGHMSAAVAPLIPRVVQKSK